MKNLPSKESTDDGLMHIIHSTLLHSTPKGVGSKSGVYGKKSTPIEKGVPFIAIVP